MATDDLVEGATHVSGVAAAAPAQEAGEATPTLYQAPQLFVAGRAADLVRGTQPSAQYKDSANDWYSPWPKGPNNPN